jgi:demethylmenaquinone methyltransferase/2-methoxy-6-polyprenyl-1,4-benzoquinol methylase
MTQGEIHTRYVRQMFAFVARRYDLLNRLLSAGLDRRWRQRAAAVACAPLGPRVPRGPDRSGPAVVLDVCIGTGDLAMAVLRRSESVRVIGCDFCRPMLALAADKFARQGLARRAALLESDAVALPLADGAVDAVTCAWGLRNLADPRRGLAEMVRVVRPGGRVVCVEFHWARHMGVLGAAFALYFRRILPRLGAWVCGSDRGGYAYLVRSIDDFGPPSRVAELLAGAALGDVRTLPLPGGVASVFTGVKGV